MAIETILALKDLEYCVDMYLEQNDNSFMEASRDEACMSLLQAVRRNKFVRVLRDNDSIVAWIYADTVKLQHQCNFNFQQLYYCSILAGVRSVRAVVDLHELMFNSAPSNSKYCVSAGSHMDQSNTFARILEKHGWQRRGYLAVRPRG